MSFEPKLGRLMLSTDDGMVEFAINVDVAAELASLMIDFLAAKESDVDEAANDG